MSEVSDPRRGSIDRKTATKAAVAIGAMAILVAILGPSVLTTPTSTPGPSGTATAVKPTSTPPRSANPATPNPTAIPIPTLEPWPDLLVPNFVATAELTPTDADRAGVATGSSFTLRSLTATQAVELARGLRINPPVALKIKAGPSADLAVIRPVEPLAEGLRYRFRLDTPDGALAGTWAFRASAPLRVVGTLPGDQTVDVPTNTGIEITFDQDGSIGVAEHFTIKPAVVGRFESHGRTWAFIPEQPLAEVTIYTVTVSKGVGISGSGETLDADVAFQFETGKAGEQVTRIGFGRSILEVRPNAAPVVLLAEIDYDREEGQELPGAVPVTIHRLPNFAAVVAAATTLAGPNGWAIASSSASVSTTGLT